MNIPPLNVALGDRSYPIHFSDTLQTLQSDVAGLRAANRPVRVFSDTNVLEAQGAYLERAGFRSDEILTLPSGESTKSVDHFGEALSFLAGQAVNRECGLFAFGGGVIGDLTGYVAASYLRGIDFYQIPTTLLAMVDSSVGGKTGINLPEGKNLAGAFWQPRAVYIGTDQLSSLPPREFAAGMAEVIKTGMLADADLFDELETLPVLAPDSPELPAVIRRCCAIKADVVAADEKETASEGGRALLNLGHTFAHAIENVAGYGHYLHGEAVAIGLHLACRLSTELRQIDATTTERVDALIQRYGLPVRLKAPLPIDALMQAMQRDKKNRAGRLRFVTLQRIGAAVTSNGINPEQVDGFWKEVGAAV